MSYFKWTTNNTEYIMTFIKNQSYVIIYILRILFESQKSILLPKLKIILFVLIKSAEF